MVTPDSVQYLTRKLSKLFARSDVGGGYTERHSGNSRRIERADILIDEGDFIESRESSERAGDCACRRAQCASASQAVYHVEHLGVGDDLL